MERHNGVRQRLSPRANQRGQMLVMFLIFLIPLTLAGLSVYNVGTMTTEKMKIQNAADNAAYSAAIWEARYLNLVAYTTRAMVANYDTIALVTGFWSFIDALDGFLAETQGFLALACLIPIIDAFACPAEIAVEAIHQVAHQGNNAVAQVENVVAPLLEAYNQGLSAFEEALYFATQAGRAQLIQQIAAGVDTNVQYWVGAELFNFQELDDRREWKGTDKDNGLRLTIEHSLNRFSNGESIRDFASLLPGPVKFLKDAISIVALGCGHVNIGPEGFDGPGFDHVTGEENPTSGDFKTGDERTLPNGNTQTIVRGGDSSSLKDTIYQVDHSGIDVEIGGCTFLGVGIPKIFGFSAGHFSADEFNGGADILHRWDSLFPDSSPFRTTTRSRSLSTWNIRRTSPTSTEPTARRTSRLCSAWATRGATALFSGFISFVNDCRTEWKLGTKLKDVNVTLYKDDGDNKDDGNRMEGPRVFVYLSKPSGSLPLFSGFGLTEGLDTNFPPPKTEVTGFTPSMEAYAFGRVYFSQRLPGDRSDKKFNKETAFNPFWAGRLERFADKNSGIELLH